MSRVALCVFTLGSTTYRYQKAKNFQKDTPSVLRHNGKYLDSDLRQYKYALLIIFPMNWSRRGEGMRSLNDSL